MKASSLDFLQVSIGAIVITALVFISGCWALDGMEPLVQGTHVKISTDDLVGCWKIAKKSPVIDREEVSAIDGRIIAKADSIEYTRENQLIAKKSDGEEVIYSVEIFQKSWGTKLTLTAKVNDKHGRLRRIDTHSLEAVLVRGTLLLAHQPFQYGVESNYMIRMAPCD